MVIDSLFSFCSSGEFLRKRIADKRIIAGMIREASFGFMGGQCN